MHALRQSILKKALEYVPEHGFTLSSIELALTDLNVSIGFNGTVQPVDLIEYQQQDILTKLKVPSDNLDFYSKVGLRFANRNNLMKPFASHWINATAELTKHPDIAAYLLQQQSHAILYPSGDRSYDLDWYVRYGLLSQMIITSDLYLTQDKTTSFAATDKFVLDLISQFKSVDIKAHKIGIKTDMFLASFGIK